MGSCFLEAIDGGDLYSIIDMFRDAPILAALSLITATLLFLYILRSTRAALQPLVGVTTKPPAARQWYIVLVCLPAMAAVMNWMTILAPGMALLFEAVFAFYEAVAIVYFAWIVLELRAHATDHMSEALVPGAADKDERSIKCSLRLIYQFVVINPLTMTIIAFADFNGSDSAETIAALANVVRIISTLTAFINLVCMVHSFYHTLPGETNVAMKFIVIKGMIVLNIIQAVIVGVVIRCGGLYTLYTKDEAQNVWQAMVFLLELPVMQALYAKYYPRSDLDTYFSAAVRDGRGGSGDVAMPRSNSQPVEVVDYVAESL